MWEKWYGHILRHALAHVDTYRHAHTHILYTHGHAYNSRAHMQGGRRVCIASHTHTVIHTSIQTRCTNRCARRRPHTPSWSLSLTLTHPRAQSYTTICQYCGQAFIEPLHTHSPPAVWQTDDEEWLKWKCTTCSPLRPLSSKPNICVSLSVCTRRRVKSSERRAQASGRFKSPGGLKDPRAWFVKQRSPIEGAPWFLLHINGDEHYEHLAQGLFHIYWLHFYNLKSFLNPAGNL